jgi:DNA-binding MarR family transcriptional regulator
MDDGFGLLALLVGAAGSVVERVDAGLADRGFGDTRPAYGFAFARISPSGATVTEVAAHLGVTKQAASELVAEMERRRYVTRRPHPDDARARLVVLTPRGRLCTEAAVEVADEVVGALLTHAPDVDPAALRAGLAALAAGSRRLRPVW